MALRQPLSQLTKRATVSQLSKFAAAPTTSIWQQQRKNLAAQAAPPVTQDATSSKGPTAMVFMNMGGPSTTGEVGDFLSRLFVRLQLHLFSVQSKVHKLTSVTGRWRPYSSWTSSRLLRPPHLSPPHPKNNKTIRSHRRWVPNPQMERIPSVRNVQNPRQNIPRNGTS